MYRTLLCLFVVLAAAAAGAARAQDAPKPTAPPEPQGMVALFNGKDLDGWDGNLKLWSFKDGIVRGETTKENPTKGNTFLIWKGGEPGDFELRLSFRINSGNSGVQYRSKRIEGKDKENQWVVSGYQAEVEDTPGKVGFLYHERGRGYLCNVGEKVEVGEDGKPKVVGKLGDKAAIGTTYKKGDWNDYVIIAKGNHLQHFINGVATVDVVDDDAAHAATSGSLAFQVHVGPPMTVEFKDVRIKKL